jgi:oligogalacturonide lyase
MKTTALVALLLCAVLFARAEVVAPAPQSPPETAVTPSFKGKVYPDEHQVFIAHESGLSVIQLTRDPADAAALNFTSDGFVPADNGLVFASRRTGTWNLFYLNLETFRFVQLTDSKQINAIGAVVSPATMEVYYRDGCAIKAVHLHTLAERKLNTIPSGYTASPLSVTLSGKTLAYTIQEKTPIPTKTDKPASDPVERFQRRPECAILAGHTNGSGWHEVLREKRWLNPALVDPLNENLILFSHEGPWEMVRQRLWLIDAGGRESVPLRREDTSSVAIGHEYWFSDGIHVGYQVTEPDGPKSVGVADVIDGSFLEYPTPYNDAHTQVSHSGDTFVGDGSVNEPYLNLYRLADGKLTGRRLWKHESAFTPTTLSPQPRFSPDDKYVLLTSTRDGNANVYLVKLDNGKN